MAEQTTQYNQLSQDLAKLLSGEAVPVNTTDLQRELAMQYVPKMKDTIGCAVVIVLFNERGQVLMTQEAKPSCRGTWHLPAGRLEPGENIVDGAKREVMEETGLTCDIVTLCLLESCRGHWMKAIFYGNVTGGQLKSLEQQDEESLQAAFYDVNTVINKEISLRKDDIIPLIQQAVKYRQSLASTPPHPRLLPVIAGHRLLLHRIVLVANLGKEAGLHILAGTSGDSPHIIIAAVAPEDIGLQTSVQCIVKEALSSQTTTHNVDILGILGMEHCGTEGKDGMCITTLVSYNVLPEMGLPPVLQESNYSWVPVTDHQSIDTIRSGLNGHIVTSIS